MTNRFFSLSAPIPNNQRFDRDFFFDAYRFKRFSAALSRRLENIELAYTKKTAVTRKPDNTGALAMELDFEIDVRWM